MTPPRKPSPTAAAANPEAPAVEPTVPAEPTAVVAATPARRRSRATKAEAESAAKAAPSPAPSRRRKALPVSGKAEAEAPVLEAVAGAPQVATPETAEAAVAKPARRRSATTPPPAVEVQGAGALEALLDPKWLRQARWRRRQPGEACVPSIAIRLANGCKRPRTT